MRNQPSAESTWAVSSGRLRSVSRRRPAAEVAARQDLINQFADHLPGDPCKVAEAVLMVTGLDEPPLRLLLEWMNWLSPM